MKALRWSTAKSAWLKQARGVSFEDIIQAQLLAVKEHPAGRSQKLMLFEYRDYVWVVPFVENDRELFLKTLYPSRKYTALQRKGSLG